MNLSKKYLILMLMSVAPHLQGCLLTSLHAKGEVDINDAGEPHSSNEEIRSHKDETDVI